MKFDAIKGYHVIQKGSPIRAIYRGKPQDFAKAQADLAHRIDQLSFDIRKWEVEMQEASDREGIREQVRFFGAENVFPGTRRKRARREEEEVAA